MSPDTPGAMPGSLVSAPDTVTEARETTPLLKGNTDDGGDSRSVISDASPYLGGITATSFWGVFSVIMFTVGLGCFDKTIMASAHPIITSDFHSSNMASWLSTAFILTSTATRPIMGRLSTTLGRKPPYMSALVLFLAATVWCALARSMMSFIFARAACGVAVGALTTLGVIMVSDLVPVEIRGSYEWCIDVVYGLASVAGAASGGAIAEAVGWRWIFGMQVPLIAAGLAMALFLIPNDLGRIHQDGSGCVFQAMRGFDYIGSLLLSSLLTFMILGLNLGGNIYPWRHPFVLTSLAFFALLVPAFLYHEARHPAPILPLDLIFKSPHSNIVISNFLLFVVFSAVIFNVPIFFRAVLFETASKTGLRLIVIFSTSAITGAVTGVLVTHTRRLKWPLMLGSTQILLGTIAIAFGMKRGIHPIWYSLSLLPASLGEGFSVPSSTLAMLSVSTQQQQAVSISILMLWRSIGTVTGVALSSLLLQNSLIHYLEKLVTGPDKDQIIFKVRESLDTIMTLEQPYRNQAVDAYANALKLTFLSSIVPAALMVAVILPLNVPRLGRKKG